MSSKTDNKNEMTIEAKARQKQALAEAKSKLAEQAKEQEEKKRTAPEHLKTKPVPAIVMLIGGAAVTINVFVRHFSLLDALICIFISLLIFLIIGDVAKMLLDRIELPNRYAVSKDGEMIEKNQNALQSGETAGAQQNGTLDTASAQNSTLQGTSAADTQTQKSASDANTGNPS